MTYSTIRHAQKQVWPEVQRSLTIRRAARDAVERDPSLATAAARARARVPWSRVVSEETIWATAKADLLNTPEQAEVLTAAREWAKSWETAPDDSDDRTDRKLYDAVQRLVTVIDIPDDVPV